MKGQGIDIEFPVYEVCFHICEDRATVDVPERLQEDPIVGQMYDFLKTLSKDDPYVLADIWREKTWDDLQDRFQGWLGKG